MFCKEQIEGVGLTAALKTMSAPSLIPPNTPPLWLVTLVTFPLLITNASLLVLPVALATSNPSPISKPLTAPIDIIALERFASNLSKTVSPIPGITPLTTHSITPPTESPTRIFDSANSLTLSAASLSGIKNSFVSLKLISNSS